MGTEILIVIFVGLVSAAALSDAVRFIIPNWLCGVIALVFPLAALMAGFSWPVFGFHLLAGFLGLVVGFALFAPGWIGGGDAKMFAAVAIWMGWDAFYPFLLHTVLAGGGLVLMLILLRHAAPLVRVPNGWTSETALEKGAPVPYGLAIAAGVFWTLPSTPIFSSF
ncbi:A24 family peptidase [Maricaulis parjimensis]|uniref:A24 family peptidase n=1 Tax=Maricaulis parjimensis TaxID=144023 RepID=UPI00193A2255|nr:prepilin peptidase [Maricaulis parjimensis]